MSSYTFIANALIFLLVGVQLNPLSLPSSSGGELTSLLIAVFAVGVVLLARLALVLVLSTRSVLALPGRTREARRVQPMARSWRLVIFWTGLRGALSLALVLALPMEVPNRSVLLVSTYAVVFFTLLVQGISLRWLLRRLPSVQAADSPSSQNEEPAPAADQTLPEADH